MSNITFTCPHCSHSVQLPVNTLGKQGNCPGCKTVVKIIDTPQQPAPQQLPPQQPAPQQPAPQQPLPQQPLPQQQLPQQPLQQQVVQLPPSYLPPPHPNTNISRIDGQQKDANQFLLDAQRKLNTENDNRDNKDVSNKAIAIIAKSLLAIILVALVVFVVNKMRVGFGNMKDEIANSAENIIENIENKSARDSGNSVGNNSKPSVTSNIDIPVISGPKITEVTVKAGDVKITDPEKYGSWCDLYMRCNNGLIIECQFKRNPGNFDFGYDITEPTVNMSYNKLAVFVTARGVIKNYLDGNYN
jgi:hypothetical protein